jgi:hypothetical protein
MIIHYNSNIFL